MIYIVYDNDDKNNRFLYNKLSQKNRVETIISPHSHCKYFSWILGVNKSAIKSKKDDTLIFWYDFQGILFAILSKILFLRRRIILLNILLKRKDTLLNRFVRKIYKYILADNNVQCTVTSIFYGEWLNQTLCLDKKFYLLHDVFHDFYECRLLFECKEKTIFCGGRNGRDWSFVFKIASLMPDITFNLVVPSNVYSRYKKLVTPNMNLYCNLSYNEFLLELCKSEIVCLPLDTESPAGLIVLFQAAANNKFIITTETSTTKGYINDSRGLLLKNDLDLWVKSLRAVLNDKDSIKLKAMNLHLYLKSKCSEDVFVNRIETLIHREFNKS